jgi:F-type H+-transporting ATPase subunit gamma
LAALIRQYLFVQLYRASAESLSSENTSRLFTMQTAEKNIDERISELNNRYNSQRQEAITSELLDVVSGFEVLSK